MKIYTKEDYLELWRTLLPDSYTAPIEDEAHGQGLDVPSSHAAIFAKFETSMNLSQQARFLREHSAQTGPIAASGRKATTTLQIGRLAPALGQLVMPAGTVALAEMLGSRGQTVLLGRYVLTEPLTLTEGTGAAVPAVVEAEYQGYDGNIEWAEVITRFAPLPSLMIPSRVVGAGRVVRNVAPADTLAFDRFSPDMVGRYLRVVPLSALATENAALVPRRIIGVFDALDGAGFPALGVDFDPPLDAGDVGVSVQIEIESWEELGVTVSQPDPVMGGNSDALTAIGAERRQGKVGNEDDEAFRERLVALTDVVSPTAMEKIADTILGPAGVPWRLLELSDVQTLQGFVLDLHPLDLGTISDIPRVPGSQLIGNGFVLFDRYRRYFQIAIGRRPIGDWGSAYDADFQPNPNALDVMFFDGAPIGFFALAAQLWEEINQKKAGGVAFQIVIDPEL